MWLCRFAADFNNKIWLAISSAQFGCNYNCFFYSLAMQFTTSIQVIYRITFEKKNKRKYILIWIVQINKIIVFFFLFLKIGSVSCGCCYHCPSNCLSTISLSPNFAAEYFELANERTLIMDFCNHHIIVQTCCYSNSFFF